MKTTVLVLMLLLSATIYAQKWVRYGMFAGSIVLNGVGDGMNDAKINKVFAHGLKAASVGMLLVTPLIDKDKPKALPYISTFILLRYAVFDASYNLARGLPYDYTGSTSVHDKSLASIPKSIVTGSRMISLGLSIYINRKTKKTT